MAEDEKDEHEIILCEPERQHMTDQGYSVRICVTVIALAPLVYLGASIVAAFTGTDLKLDDRILTACLAGWATIIFWGFKKKN